MERRDATCQADEEGASVDTGHDDAECVCKNQETNIPLCPMKPRDQLTPDGPQGTIVALMIEPESCHTVASGCHLERGPLRTWART